MSGPLLEAAVFDLDGVVTRTARVHFAAWKQLFEGLVPTRRFLESEYLSYVDGKPRLEGIRAYLAVTGLSLPEGSPADPAGAQTVQGLGKLKNQFFAQLLDRMGVEVDEAAVDFIRQLRSQGVRVGAATSSRNAKAVLQRAGLEDLFQVRVDGVLSAQLGLQGKPHPDAFLECLRRLGAASPEKALVVEDAASGVQAGKAGRFGLVVGVDRGDNWLRLRQAGADWVVRELSELSLEGVNRYLEGRPHLRPNALLEWPALENELRGRRLAVFLDYDGTLTPIVERPENAVLEEPMRRTLLRLSRAFPTQIISGRALQDVQRRVGIDSLWVAGSHGFDIAAPQGQAGGAQVAAHLEPLVHQAAVELRGASGEIPGVLVEDKRFTIAVHYRLTPQALIPSVERLVDEAVARHPALKKTHGKKVFQLEPAMEWDKGQALLWLLKATGQEGAFPIYLGDDDTDEAALAVVAKRGLGILVTELPRPTSARYCLQHPVEVQAFLSRLALLGQAPDGGRS